MKAIKTLLLLIITIQGLCQYKTADSAVDCVIHWQPGAKKTYSIIHEKSTTGGPGNAAPFRFVYEADVTVIDSSAQTFTVKWEFRLPDDFKMAHPRLSDSLPVFNGMSMIFKISKMGAFVTLENWEQVRDAYVKQMEISLPRKQDSFALATMKAVKEMFNSKTTVEATLVREIQLFHTLYGYRFTTREASESTQLPNPFGGEPFPAYQTYQLTNLDPAKDAYTIVFRLKMDTANLNKISDPLFEKMNIKDNASLEEARKQLKNYNIQDFTEYRFIKSTGWVSRLFYERSVTNGVTKQSDFYTISLK
ncbi:MAG: hypothetical protein JST68_12005 [Bacteroidetes bacterium]|nr:hypothetical protein [Bacteroidota bacterium]